MLARGANMRLNDIHKGLRVWITNPAKVPLGYLPYGTVTRVFDHLGDHPVLNIGVLLDQEGHVVGSLRPEDLDFE